MEQEWTEYLCKSGETIFLYNKVTGEHKWPPNGLGPGMEARIIYGRPVTYKELRTLSTQTDDNCCPNGCMSEYINIDQSHGSNTSHATLPQQQPGISDEEMSSDFQIFNNDDCDLNSASEDGNEEPNGSGGGEDENDVCKKENEDFDNHIQTPGENQDADGEVVNSDDNNVENSWRSTNLSEPQREAESQENHFQTCNEWFECFHCKKTFETKISLDNHIEMEYFRFNYIKTENSDDHTVETSERSTPQREGESQEHHQAINKLFECFHCKKTFETKISLVNHIEMKYLIYKSTSKSMGQKRKIFECDVCKKTFSRQSSLSMHSTIHTGERPYECTVCKKSFRQMRSLTKHLSIHLRPYKCIICKSPFTEKHSLTMHTMIHSEIKRFECTVCAKMVPLKEYMLEHTHCHKTV